MKNPTAPIMKRRRLNPLPPLDGNFDDSEEDSEEDSQFKINNNGEYQDLIALAKSKSDKLKKSKKLLSPKISQKNLESYSTKELESEEPDAILL